jgi:hypothetical protein
MLQDGTRKRSDTVAIIADGHLTAGRLIAHTPTIRTLAFAPIVFGSKHRSPPRRNGATEMYVYPNFRSKKSFKDAVKNNEPVTLASTSPFEYAPENGVAYVSGPHYPEPHKWYAKVTVKDGKIVKVA